MRSSIYAKWVRSHKFQAYLVIPAMLNLVLIILYFSDSHMLQSLVAPRIYGMDSISANKVGALELIQAFILVCALFFGIRCLLGGQGLVVKLVTAVILGLTVFVFLQELDYGSHYREYFNRPPVPVRMSSIAPAAAPQAPSEAERVASQFGLAICGGVVLLYLLAPMIPVGRNRTLRLLVPNFWLASGAVLSALLFFLVWHLYRQGHSVIEGVPGNLDQDLGEFLQLNVYYYLLMYLTSLHERIVIRQ